jgi:hypothetical protein
MHNAYCADPYRIQKPDFIRIGSNLNQETLGGDEIISVHMSVSRSVIKRI